MSLMQPSAGNLLPGGGATPVANCTSRRMQPDQLCCGESGKSIQVLRKVERNKNFENSALKSDIKIF